MSKAFSGAISSKTSNLNERDSGSGKDSPAFTYLTILITASSTTTFVNNDTSLWVLVFGFDATAITAGANARIVVNDSAGHFVSGVSWFIDTSTTVFVLAVPVKFLIPPGGNIIGVGAGFASTFGQAVKGKFEDLIKFI